MKDFPREITVSEAPVPDGPPVHDASTGGVAQFLGVVRDLEDGKPIRGIDYEAYLPMAEAVLARITDEASENFGPHPVRIHHQLGFVAAGSPSILIAVAMPHSAEAFDLCHHYLKRIKAEVPIWKRIVYA